MAVSRRENIYDLGSLFGGFQLSRKPNFGESKARDLCASVQCTGYSFTWCELSYHWYVAKVAVPIPAQPYDGFIEAGLLNNAGSILHDILPPAARCFVITAPTVRKAWAEPLMNSLAASGLQAQILEMPEGESHKTFSTVERLARKLV